MSKDLLLKWLREQQAPLEEVLLKSAEEYYSKNHTARTFGFDAKKTGEELWHLGGGEDLCYDRPTIGFNYALWYHPKRINTFLRYFTDLIYDSRNEKNIEIFDLGAGTGAVLWAVGLVVQGLKTLNLSCPKIRVVNIDTSPFMLDYNQNYLWKNFNSTYPLSKGISNENDYRLNSWSNLDETNCSNIWLCASYLFDHSENSQAIANDFQEIIKRYSPNRVLLLSAMNKKVFCDAVATHLHQSNMSSYDKTFVDQVFTGSAISLYQFRNKISQQHGLNLRGTPSWNIDSLYGRILLSKSPTLSLDFNSLNLFIQPERNRAKIRMTKPQEEAAAIVNRPTLIIGPAGCGKSVVLTQKIKNIINASKNGNDYNPNLKILVTSFNKGLIKYIGDWIEQLLEPGKFIRRFNTYNNWTSEYSYFQFNNSKQVNIYVVHFDILPTKIGDVRPLYDVTRDNPNIEDFHYNRMKSALDLYVTTHKVNRTDYTKILDPDFLLEEYQRVIYGMECNTEKAYQTIERTGRGNNPQLRYKSKRRTIVWGIIRAYLQDLSRNNLESFIIRRHRLIKKIRASGFPSKFSHILVDEFQDCTKTDYEIFYQMLSDPNNLTLAGDIAQSIHLGTALHIPRADDPRMGNFLKKKLEGSFRLPFRVSECIRPLSEVINKKFGEREGVQADVINPYKGAPPGSRPIFVFASDTTTAKSKIKEIFSAYNSILKLERVTIFEKDIELSTALNSDGTPAETEIILRTKGLEKNCVVWSTRTNIDSQNEIEEFVYTILTRTVSLLIILVFPEIRKEFKAIISSLVRKRLIFWDEESEQKYLQITNSIEEEPMFDDIDNSEDHIESEDENIDGFIR
ncbi:MAG TPA: UvrD-helicase domain-containing protein [Bacteroidia bacterium]|nr:UvrD-helicase domain-containing protein [Bacteroidia bacterium]